MGSQETSAERQQVDVCTFWVGNNRMGMLLHDMKEIVPYRPLSKLPNRKVSALGVISLRGELMPVYELSDLIGLAYSGSGAQSGFFLVVDHKPVFAVRIDKADAIFHLSSGELHSPPKYARKRNVSHIAIIEGQHVPLLSLVPNDMPAGSDEQAWPEFMAELMNAELNATSLIAVSGEKYE